MKQLKRTLAAGVAALAASGAWATPTVSPTTVASILTNSIAGAGIEVLSSTYTGQTGQAGTFTGGASSIGFDSGVVLSSGNVSAITGNNSNTGSETNGDPTNGTGGGQISSDMGGSAYAPLGANTDDASYLTVRFRFGDGTVGGDVGIRYVFASDEYLGYVGSQFNDLFAFFLDGVNVALVPGSAAPVAINSVNPTTNSAYYINNVDNTDGLPVAGKDFQFDGLTTILTASATGLAPGEHTMTFVVADVGDDALDSAVFLQAGTFSPDTKPDDVPEPTSLLLSALGLVALAATQRRRAR